MDPGFVAIVESYSTIKGKFDLICSVCQMNNHSMISTLQNKMESLKLRKGTSIQEKNQSYAIPCAYSSGTAQSNTFNSFNYIHDRNPFYNSTEPTKDHSSGVRQDVTSSAT
jgi:hypothetical protein